MKTQTDYAVNYDIKIMKRIYIIYKNTMVVYLKLWETLVKYRNYACLP